MKDYKQNAGMLRGEQAFIKEKRLKVAHSAPHYRIEGDDLLLLTGPFKDYWLKALWCQGDKERDYIYKHIYSIKNEEVQQIVRQLFCQ